MRVGAGSHAVFTPKISFTECNVVGGDNHSRQEDARTFPTPTGFHHPAQGCRVSGYLGIRADTRGNPEGVESIPNMAFIQPNVVARQQGSKLILE